MRFIFWFSLAGVLYTYLGYPVLLWIAAKMRPRPWRSAEIHPEVSVVLAVHNGLALLQTKLERLLALDYSNIKEVIIVSDGSSDGTAEFLARQNAPRLRTIILEAHGGKAVAVSTGMAQATGELILFIDLRPDIAAGAIQHLVNNFADERVGCVAGEYVLYQDKQADDSAPVGRAYWTYEQWLRNTEALIDSAIGVPGCFYAVRRALAQPQPAGIILDDMFQPLSIIRQGYRCVVDPEARVFDRWSRMGGEFHRKVRTLAGNFQLFALAPWLWSPQNRVFFQLFSHKVMRLVVPYLLVLLLVSALVLAPGSIFFTMVAAAQVFFWLIAMAGSRYRIPVLHPIASPAAALLALNAAAVVGFYKFLFTRGPLWKIWNSGRPADAGVPSATGL